jgi:hypothetical protein
LSGIFAWPDEHNQPEKTSTLRIVIEAKLEPNTLDVAITKYELEKGGKFEIRISKSETNSNFEFSNVQNKNHLYKIDFSRFGHLKLGTRPQGGESGGPILRI